MTIELDEVSREPMATGLSLIFKAGQRPSVGDIEALVTSMTTAGHGARITRLSEQSEGCLELLVNGLTFDLTGLAPDPASAFPKPMFRFGFAEDVALENLEAITFAPGAHIASGMRMMPVLKAMLNLAANIALPLPIVAVCWHPAASWMEPNYFARIVLNWLAGGAFPALGLAGFEQRRNGVFESVGLDYVVGQEIRVEGVSGGSPEGCEALAKRFADRLMARGPLKSTERFQGLLGETLVAEPSSNGRLVMIWQDG